MDETVALPDPELPPVPAPPPREPVRRRLDPRALLGTLAALVLAMLVFLFLTVTQDLDKRRGDELFARQRFQEALGYYQRAEARASSYSRPELIYRIAACYERLGQCDRAVDFFYRLLKDFPGDEWEPKAKQGLLACLSGPSDRDRVVDPTKGPLVAAKVRWHRSYGKLVSILHEHRSGVSRSLEEAYLDYKKAHQEYTAAIAAGLQAVDRGVPP